LKFIQPSKGDLFSSGKNNPSILRFEEAASVPSLFQGSRAKGQISLAAEKVLARRLNGIRL
jgi:hypothetical protein